MTSTKIQEVKWPPEDYTRELEQRIKRLENQISALTLANRVSIMFLMSVAQGGHLTEAELEALNTQLKALSSIRQPKN